MRYEGTVGIHGLFSLEGLCPNPDWDPMTWLMHADVIIAVDVNSMVELTLFGREVELGFGTCIARIELDFDAACELHCLLILVKHLRGRHDLTEAENL
jgi:hypothetical protein